MLGIKEKLHGGHLARENEGRGRKGDDVVKVVPWKPLYKGNAFIL